MAQGFKATRTQKRQFSPRQIETLKADGAAFEIAEPGGLRILVGRRTKTFIYRFKSPETGKSRKLNLGRYPTTSLAVARKKVLDAKGLIGEGTDPATVSLEEKQARKDAPTIAELTADYLQMHASRKRSGHEDRTYLEREVIPRFGNRKAGTIARREIVQMLDEVAARAPVSANRLLVYVRLLFAFGVDREYVLVNPAIGIKPPRKAEQRQRVLTDQEIVLFWTRVDTMPCAGQIKQSLKFALVTAQRIGEVTSMRWDDIEGTWWTIPSSGAKNKLAHRVPLTDLALSILEEAKDCAGNSELVFPGRDPALPLSKTSAGHALRRSDHVLGISDFHIHDLRRSAASHMTAIGIPRLTVAKVLNHAETGVTAVYDRHSYDIEKRRALEIWERRLTDILAGKAFRSITGELDDLRLAYESGRDQRAVLTAVLLALENGEIPPAWAMNVFLPALRDFTNGQLRMFPDQFANPNASAGAPR